MKGKKIPVLGLGTGGHAKVVVEAIQAAGGYRIVGMLDPKKELWNTYFLGAPVLGGDELLTELYQKKLRHVFIGMGSSLDLTVRKKIYDKAIQHGFQVIAVIHPKAIISSSCHMKQAPSIMAAAVLDPGVCLGVNVLVNVGSYIGHDSVIGDHVHVAPHVALGSAVCIGDCSFIGL
ncbi:MAG: serine acetyltransferase, partial [Candidatus Omnitrophica bacterium]|nr:serine acetyltransferase [Candidatus Omnitrophota bacterium]